MKIFLVVRKGSLAMHNGASIRYESIKSKLESLGHEIETVELKALPLPRPLKFAAPFLQLRSLSRLEASEGRSGFVFFGAEFGPLANALSPSNNVLLDICDSLNKVYSGQSGNLTEKLRATFSKKLLFFFLPKNTLFSYITSTDLRSDEDQLPSESGVVISNVVHDALRSISPSTSHPGRLRVGFVGDFSYAPNFSGLNWFLSNVFPEVDGDIELLLFGPHSENVEAPPAVKKFGFVPSLVQVYSGFDVAICPDFSGAGFKNKVAEAIRAGRPIITTSRGAVGQPEGSGIFVSEQSSQWISQLKWLSQGSNLTKSSETIKRDQPQENEFKSYARLKELFGYHGAL